MEEMGVADIFDDPSRVYNTDETCIQLCPSTGKVIGITGWKNIYEVAPGPEKSTLTFLGTFNARGDIVAPMIIYPYVRIPKDIVNNVPDEFSIGRSDSGWMKAEIFYDFIGNAFVLWLAEHEIEKPIILFVDGHRTHMSMQVSMLCEDNGIILYLLPPNCTHILQPADVGPFKPLKSYWRSEVIDFQWEHPNSVVRRKHVALLLQNVLKKVTKESIINGFRACGLYPINPDGVDYSKCLDVIHEEYSADNNREAIQKLAPSVEEYRVALKVIKHELGEKTATLEEWNTVYGSIMKKSQEDANETDNIITSPLNVNPNQEPVHLEEIIDFDMDGVISVQMNNGNISDKLRQRSKEENNWVG